jgi:hypothetical protein
VEGEAPLALRDNGELECTIEHTFKNEEERVEFAFCYPYQYEKMVQYLAGLNELAGDS